MKSKVIGIDLGTTNTCVACYENGRVKILENKEGHRTTPSDIYVTQQPSFCVGFYAKRLAPYIPENFIYGIKRLIGRKFDDPQVQKDLKYFPFRIDDVNNDPVIKIEGINDVQLSITPVELCTAILKEIKNDAEAKLGESVHQAVITVPAYFNNSQRSATLLAADKAGFTILKLLNEPTAAALTYYLDHKEEKSCLLVYDLGGGTFDVAVVKRIGNNIDIVGVDGDAHLGGSDFDDLLVDHVCDYLKTQYGYDPRSNRRALIRLRYRCEDAKKELSLKDKAIITFDGFVPWHPKVDVHLTRDQFEKMARKLFQATIDIVDGCLKSCKVPKTAIQEVILSGGSTRIPKIQKMISQYFGGKKLNKTVNPDECVAKGAAIRAAMFSTNEKQKVEIFKITEVTPLSLGLRYLGDLMAVIIERNTPIPTSRSVISKTVYNQQKVIRHDIYEGERRNARKNRFLGRIEITNLTPAPPGRCLISLTMSIDENGVLKVRAEEKFRDNVRELTVTYTRGHRNDNEVKNALKDAEENRAEDESFVEYAKMQNYIVKYCEVMKYNLLNANASSLKVRLFCCDLFSKWARDITLEDKDQLKTVKKRMIDYCQSVADSHNFKLLPTYNE